ncbi:HAD hydrolase-like protein [Fusicatenibacter sp.]
MSDIILFDLDGTLTDSGPGITRCVQYALASFGIEETDLEKLNCYVGPPLLESFVKFAGLNREEAEQAIEKYRERYESKGIFENAVYQGIPEVLAYLKEQGKTLAVASSKPEPYVEKILEYFEIRTYFTVVTGSEMNESRTGKGEVIAETLRRLGAEDRRSDVVMVGDRSYDVIGARENGLLCVGVSYGYGGREELEKAGAAKICDTPEELKMLAEDPKEEKKRRDHIKKMKPERIPWLTRGEAGTGIFAPKEKKAENAKETKTEKKERKSEEIVIPIQRKLWRLLKPLLTYELFLIGATVLLALILMTFTTGGYLEERMHATSVLASAIGSLAAIPILFKQYKKDDGMFPEPEKRWSAAEAAACVLLVMTFGHLLNTVMNVTGFTRIFSGYQNMASKIYEGQNPLLLILSVGVLSAAAEEIVFRGMIYRRAKDFWGTGWGIAASCLLFGAYHGNMTQFVYATVVSVLLILIYERCGTLLAPVLAHIAENIWGLYRSQFVSWLTKKAPAGAWMFVFLEAVVCAGTFWYLFLKDKPDKKRK